MVQNNERKFEQFVPLTTHKNIREIYTQRVEKTNESGWPKTSATIERHNPDGTVTDVYTYTRNYSMYRTFEPFRQLKNGQWHDYALISPQYTRFSVVDLEKGEIVATEAYPVITEEIHERWKKKGFDKLCEQEPVGTEKPGWGFCPVEFYVPDITEYWEEDEYNKVHPGKDGEPPLYPEEYMNNFTGQYALYTGCIWGDDSGGWKLRYIDLSRISEGIVTSDERFGYFPVHGSNLKESVNIWDEGTRFTIPLEVHVDLKSGQSFGGNDVNW